MKKELNKIKPKKGEDPKCDKIEALNVKYQDQAEIIDNDTIVTNFFLVCTKLYKSESTDTQVEAEVNDKELTHKSLIRHMNVACLVVKE